MGVATGSAAAAQQVIASSGPLTDIFLNDGLQCQFTNAGDSSPEVYGGTDPGACGTFLSVGGTVYGPNDLPAGPSSPTPFTPVSQSAVTGSGTGGDPYKVVTVVNVGTTGLQISQSDTYVSGQDDYGTAITVTNQTGSPIGGVVLFHGLDCYLGNADVGYGAFDSPTGTVSCTKAANN